MPDPPEPDRLGDPLQSCTLEMGFWFREREREGLEREDSGKENGNYSVVFWGYTIGILEKEMENYFSMLRGMLVWG